MEQYNRSLVRNPLSNIRICSINLKVDDFACGSNKTRKKKKKKTFEILCVRIRSKVVSVFLDRGKSFSSTLVLDYRFDSTFICDFRESNRKRLIYVDLGRRLSIDS